MKKTIITTIIVIFIIILAIVLFGGEGKEDKYTGPIEKIKVGSPVQELSTLAYIAKEKGFFIDNGLDVEIVDLQSGVESIQKLHDGEIDIALTSEFVVVSNVMEHSNLEIISCLADANVLELLALKDKGINKVSDLVGKKIGVTKKSSSMSFLGSFLIYNNLKLTDVELIDLNPLEMKEALKAGSVDAIVIWPPHTFNLKKDLGDSLFTTSIQQKQYFHWLAVVNSKKPIPSEDQQSRFLKALAEAENYLKNNLTDSQTIVKKYLNQDDDYIDYFWPRHNFKLNLAQELILLMEDETRWAISENLFNFNEVPNYLEYINILPLKEINPKAVTIIN